MEPGSPPLGGTTLQHTGNPSTYFSTISTLVSSFFLRFLERTATFLIRSFSSTVTTVGNSVSHRIFPNHAVRVIYQNFFSSILGCEKPTKYLFHQNLPRGRGAGIMLPLKILVADDHEEFRRVVHEFLDRLPNIFVVGEASDGQEAVEQVERLRPDVVLMDISMPRQNGLEATRIIKERWPLTKVVIATMHDNPMYRIQALEVKADEFILKSTLKPSLESTLSVYTRENGG